MELLLEGIQIGLVLAVMTGPLLFTLVQVSVEEGIGPGLMVGAGIWISDLLFVFFTTWSLAAVVEAFDDPMTSITIGIVGGAILIFFGIGTALSKPKNLSFKSNQASRYSSWFSLWLKGFLINTINPFTVFFWIGIVSTIVVKNAMSVGEASLFFGGLLGTVAITDALKVLLSKRIRKFLQAHHIIWLRRISGAALVVFGIVLLVRVFALG